MLSAAGAGMDARDSLAYGLCRRRAVAAPVKRSDGAKCQPGFYRRLVAYGFVGLSEGAYGGA